MRRSRTPMLCSHAYRASSKSQPPPALQYPVGVSVLASPIIMFCNVKQV